MNRLITPLVTHSRKRVFLLALLLAFLVRASIPMGYMPTLNPGQPAKFSLSLCISGLSTAAVQVLNLDASHELSEYPEHHCAFGSVLAKFGPATPDIVFLPTNFFAGMAQPVVQEAELLAWRILGPPLGSRAPPVYRSI